MDNQHLNQIPHGLVLGIKLRNSVLSNDLKNDLENEIRELIDLRVISSTYERGTWRIKFQDEAAKSQFIEAMQQLQLIYPQIMIMSFDDVPIVRYETNIPARNLTGIKVLTTIQRENAGIDASSWIIAGMTERAHGFQVRTIVDAISDEFITERQGFLNFGSFEIFLRKIINN